MKRLMLAIAMVTSLLLAGCMGATSTELDTNQASSQDDEVCSIAASHFTLQRGGASPIASDQRWENPCPFAKGYVQMGGTGTLDVTVKDADGETVLHTRFLPGAGGKQEFQTSARGEPGAWTVEVTGAYAGGVQVFLEPQPSS